jgi:hypothetical protein
LGEIEVVKARVFPFKDPVRLPVGRRFCGKDVGILQGGDEAMAREKFKPEMLPARKPRSSRKNPVA